MSQRIHNESQNLAHELRQFRSGWSYFPALTQFDLAIGDLIQTLNWLSRDLRSHRYAQATQVEGDQQWLAKLHKLEESIASPQSAAELLKELFPPAERLRAQCEKLLSANKSWSPEFRNCLTNSLAALRNFLEGKGLRSRIDTLEKQLARERQVAAGRVWVKAESASLVMELAASRQVLGLLGVSG